MKKGNAAIFAVAANLAVMFMGSTLLTPLYILYRREFGFSQLVLTLVYATYVIGNLAALFLIGACRTKSGGGARACPRSRSAPPARRFFFLRATRGGCLWRAR